EREKLADFLKFQIEELRAAELRPGEDQELQLRKQLLQSGESRAQTAEAVRQIFEDDEEGSLNALRAALTKLRTLSQTDAKAEPIQQALERALAEAEDASLQLNRYLSSVELDPEQLLRVQERLSLLVDLRRKYGETVEEMLATLDRLQGEAASLGQTGERLEQLTEELELAREKLRKLGGKLSSARKK